MVGDETVAGCAAGVVGTLLGFPLDNIKTRMQTQSTAAYSSVAQSARTIANTEGFMGFYRGIAAPLSALTILNTLNFSSYSYFRSAMELEDVVTATRTGTGTWTLQPMFFVAGAMAGPLASFISTPFEMLKTQVTTNMRYGSTLAATRIIFTTHGPALLYRAHAVNTLREMVFLGTYFFVYEHMKGALTQVLPYVYGVPMAGGLSGGVGWFVSFPLDSVKGIIQAGALESRPQAASSVARQVLQTKGLFGLYRGLAPSITRAFLVSSVRFSVYEFVMDSLRMKRERRGG
jgi:solute carrier family 25 carnitine/acylcarnitine transporter 20/29